MSMGAESGTGEGTNRAIHRDVMPAIAKELGIPELPMRRPGFNFYTFAVYKLRQMGFVGQDLENTAHDILSSLFFQPKTGQLGLIYGYPAWYKKLKDQGQKPQPFDAAFIWWFVKRARSALRKLVQQRKKQRGFVSIEYGRGEDEGSIGEEFLPESREPSPYEALEAKEANPKKEKALAAVPKMLTEHRNGAAYVEIWDLMQEEKDGKKKYTDAALANLLNSMQVESPGESKEWTGGLVAKARYIIYELVRKHFERYGVDAESIAASRKRVKFSMRG